MATISNAPESEAITMDDAAVFEAARAGVVLLKKTFETWVTIGRAVERARATSPTVAAAVEPSCASSSNEDFGEVVAKATASNLLRIMERIGEVTTWHASLTTRQQIDWAAPSTILKRCPV